MNKAAPSFKETEEEVRRQLQKWSGLTYEEVTDLAIHGELNHDVFWHPVMQDSLRTFIREAELKVGYRLSIDEFGHVMTSSKFETAAREGLIKLTETLAANSVEKEFEAKADPDAIAGILSVALGDMTGVPDTIKALVKKDALTVALRQKRMQIIHTKIDQETQTYTELRIQSVGHNGRFLMLGGTKGKIQIKLTIMKYEYQDVRSRFFNLVRSRFNLGGANQSHSDQRGLNLDRPDLRGVDLNDIAQLDAKWRVVWEIVNQGAERRDLRRADLSDTYLSEANLSQANLREAKLYRADLSRAKLSEAVLAHDNLRKANLSGADLSGADLSGADLSWANLSGADLSGANLSGADLRNANLNGTNLCGANLRGANLSQAGLSQANLREADLSGAKLFLVNLSEANLRETLGLIQDQINATKGNMKTTLPNGLVKPQHWSD